MNSEFLVGLSADFRLANGEMLAPDLGLSLLDQTPGLRYELMATYEPEYRAAQLEPYDVVLSLKPKVTAASLSGASRLCAIGRYGVGYDNVDLGACTAADIAVYITPQAVIRPMAESVVAFVLALSHGLVRKDRLVREGRWTDSLFPLGQEPRGRVVGLVGFGGIGRETVRLLKPFGPARFLVHDPYVSPETIASEGVESASLDEVLEQADYLLILCPLTDESRGMIGAPQIARMKPSARLINAARGGIVDQDALVEALQQRRIAGAALDVFAPEPLTDPAHPLCALDNVVLTSHSIGWTEELFRDMGTADCEGALAIYEGRAPANVVNREVLDRPGFQEKLARRRQVISS